MSRAGFFLKEAEYLSTLFGDGKDYRVAFVSIS